MPSTWADSGIGFSKAQLNRVDDFRAWLRKSSLKLARELADPPAAFTVTTVTPKARRDMRRLEKALILDRSSTSAAHIDSQILLKFIAYQNKQFDAKLPPPHVSSLHFALEPLLQRSTFVRRCHTGATAHSKVERIRAQLD